MITTASIVASLAINSAISPIALASDSGHADPRSWHFSVYLDERDIGTHRFEVLPQPDHIKLVSEAEFQVSILFFNAYRYQHRSEERWRDGCLQSVDAQTNDDGEHFQVVGKADEDGFVLGQPKDPLSDCVMTFAYWNPNFLKQQRLLNVQTGDYVGVAVSPIEGDGLAFDGGANLHGYRIRSHDGEMLIDVWYDGDGDWVALDAAVEDGKVLRYRRRSDERSLITPGSS